MAARKTSKPSTRAPARKRTPRKAKAESTGLLPVECALDGKTVAAVRDLIDRIEGDGGLVVGSYKDPLGGHPLVLAVLPIGKVDPTPFQRDLSEAHHKRLAEVISKTGRFLDPIITVTAPKEGYWTPNGRHRLEAMRRLGARAVTSLVVPSREVAWQILALNTEKAHNLKERSLEVVRIYRDLLGTDGTRPESSFAFYLEDPALVTLGACYEKEPRFAGGAYHPVLRRTERFVDVPLREAVLVHEQLATQVLELEAQVGAVIATLKERGLTSPYLRSFVVSRINPLRWIKGEPPAAEKVIAQMLDRARKFDAARVKQEDLARMAGGAPDET